MGAIANGLAVHGGVIPFTATFLIFSDYMRPPIRLAALMEQGVTFVFTHDSLAVGEDGSTHQAIEQLASLRAIPNLLVIRPCDANETAVAWRVAIQTRDRPVALILTRQDVPTFDRTARCGEWSSSFPEMTSSLACTMSWHFVSESLPRPRFTGAAACLRMPSARMSSGGITSRPMSKWMRELAVGGHLDGAHAVGFSASVHADCSFPSWEQFEVPVAKSNSASPMK
jgi:hypothetical protein